MNLKVKKFLEKIENKKEEIEDFLSNQRYTSHADYCKFKYNVNEETKTVTLLCDNNTGFSNGCTEIGYIKNIEDWTINLIEIHSTNNLTCLRMCELFFELKT